MPEPLPELGYTVSHELLELADQARVPPLFVRVTVCGTGVFAPSVYEKLTSVMESDMEGGGAAAALTVRSTDIVLGAIRRSSRSNRDRAAVCLSAQARRVNAEVKVPGPVPEAGETVSQGLFELAAQDSVPLPELVIWMD
jgi:hypothetical protein